VYEPVTTLAAVMASDAPPDYLFQQAAPMTIITTLVMAAIIGRLYGRRLVDYAVILLTSAVLVLLLGLNISVIGLISIPRSSVYLIGELAGLILALNVVFAVVFAGLEVKTFFNGANRLRSQSR